MGGAVFNAGQLTINNSTLAGNSAYYYGGGIFNNAYGGGTLTINNSTLSGNSANTGGGIYIHPNNQHGTAILQNSVLANNSSGGNCSGSISSNGYNMSSDDSCNFSNSGDRNDTNPLLGPLQNNGGPTQTMALLPGSPAIDAGNPSGCTDGNGHLLTTDQRGMPRPDSEDTGGCDMGAYESQTGPSTRPLGVVASEAEVSSPSSSATADQETPACAETQGVTDAPLTHNGNCRVNSITQTLDGHCISGFFQTCTAVLSAECPTGAPVIRRGTHVCDPFVFHQPEVDLARPCSF